MDWQRFRIRRPVMGDVDYEIGFESPLGMTRRFRLPPGLTVEAWLSPSTPPWEYVPTRGNSMRLIRVSAVDHRIFALADGLSCIDALIEFVHTCLPQRRQGAYIADGNNQQVLGWAHTPNGVVWSGTAYMFEMLATVHEPVDCALWETMARESRENDLDLGEYL